MATLRPGPPRGSTRLRTLDLAKRDEGRSSSATCYSRSLDAGRRYSRDHSAWPASHPKFLGGLWSIYYAVLWLELAESALPGPGGIAMVHVID